MAGKYKLYGWKQTGSLAIEAALSEAGAAFDIIPVSRKTDENLTEAYRAINPRQQLPALVLPDGSIMTEGSAMLLHIADAHPQAKLAPPPGSSARAQHDRWLAFFQANVYEGELREIRPERYSTDPADAAAIKQAATAYVRLHFRIYEDALSEGPYLFGQWFTMIDIYVWMVTQWVNRNWMARECPKVALLAATVAARPKIAPVHAYHFSDFSA